MAPEATRSFTKSDPTERNERSQESLESRSPRVTISNEEMHTFQKDRPTQSDDKSITKQFGSLTIIDGNKQAPLPERSETGIIADGAARGARVGGLETNADGLPLRPAAPRINSNDEFRQQAEAVFDRVDTDHNNYLSAAELGAGVQNSQFTGAEAQVVAGMYAQRAGLSRLSNDDWLIDSEISRADVAAITNDNQDASIGLARGNASRTREGQDAQTSNSLYASEDPLQSINPDAIRQGNIGNCYFQSSLAALAQSNPQAIRDMIRDNGNGTYTVTFPGDTANPVTVSAQTDAERGLFNGGSQYGTWAGVMERAYGQYWQDHGGAFTATLRGLMRNMDGYTPAEGADGGGRPEYAMALLTGHTSDVIHPWMMSPQDLGTQLNDALNGPNRRPVTTGINNNPFVSQTGDGIPDGHAYSVLAYIPDSNGAGHVVIRNPWGQGQDNTGGTFTITVEEFQRNFSDVAIDRGA